MFTVYSLKCNLQSKDSFEYFKQFKREGERNLAKNCPPLRVQLSEESVGNFSESNLAYISVWLESNNPSYLYPFIDSIESIFEGVTIQT